MAMTTPSRKERAAAVANGLFAPLAKRQLLAGLGDVVHKKVPLNAIEPNPRQPRQAVDETSAKFDDLVGSIRQQGLIQPISLWQLDEDAERYLLIAGERRWRAFRRLAEENPAEYSRIPATVTGLEGEQPAARALMMGLIENVVREDLKDGERAEAMARLKESTGWTYEQIAERMGMGVSRVLALSSIARHEAVRTAVDEGTLTQKQAILIGQGIREPELAAELVTAVSGLDERATRAAVQIARGAPSRLPARTRARTAVEAAGSRGVAVVAATSRPGSGFAGRGSTVDEEIQLAATPLGRLMGRPAVPRAELTEILIAACQEMGIWPIGAERPPS